MNSWILQAIFTASSVTSRRALGSASVEQPLRRHPVRDTQRRHRRRPRLLGTARQVFRSVDGDNDLSDNLLSCLNLLCDCRGHFGAASVHGLELFAQSGDVVNTLQPLGEVIDGGRRSFPELGGAAIPPQPVSTTMRHAR